MEIKDYKNRLGKPCRSVQIARFDTKGTILDFEDTFSIWHKPEGPEFFPKVKLTLTVYGEGKESQTFYHNMEYDALLLVGYDIAERMCKKSPYDSEKPYSYEEYKGRKDAESPTGFTSSVLRITYWPEGGRGQGAYTIELQTGPGVANETGAVGPSKSHPQRKGKIILAIPDARKKFYLVKTYLQAKMTAMLTTNWADLFEYNRPAPTTVRESIA